MKMRVRVLADDLTGALEAGAHFARHGLRTAVVTGRARPAGYEVVVVDLESRHVAAEVAAAAVTEAVAGENFVYQKTDSTLRGNIGAHLQALAQCLPGARMAYLPAYPALGRTVRKGCLLVNGVPVHQTAFARDPLNPIAQSFIPALLPDGLPCVVCDGESDADVEAALERALADADCRILAGPASVAAALAARIGVAARPAVLPEIRSCLLVNGSLHPASLQQVEHARAAGCLSGEWRTVTTDAPPGTDPLEVAGRTAARVRDCIAAAPPDALAIFGGDTAFAIWKALGLPMLEPVGEVVPGVPLTRVAGRALYWITKAGGYGDPSLICRLRQVLHVH
jgi:uncharacterized protein YgbK (DUF1537 family)